ncbi:coiled-coil domain-containing protein 171-like isoform X2 [Xenia sp. Carnegie-2017]|nr:coiled-coil domain-containing protein 171-like isoform X2 [Xenia sp. Carnegie-2017]
MISENSVHFTFDGGNTYDVVEPQTAAETQMNSSRSIHSEKEIESLKLKIAQLEAEALDKIKIFNEEKSTLESNVVRLRAQVERGEATRQNLEYELTLAKKNANQVKRLAAEKDGEVLNNMASLKEQLSENMSRFDQLEKELENCKKSRKNETIQWKKHLEVKDDELNKMAKKLEDFQKESLHLNKMLHQQQNALVDMQEKCSSLEAQRQSQSNTLRHQAKDIEFSVEREERLKTELEQARERIKSLEEHVEAERASHLETKFNSEVIQLRASELEADAEVKSTSLKEAMATIDNFSQQNKDFEERLKIEQESHADAVAKLTKLQEKYVVEKKKIKGDLEEKQNIIKELSQKLEVHQQDFDTLKRELTQAKRHQNEYDINYNECVSQLQSLLTTFGGSKSPGKKKLGRDKDDSTHLFHDIRQMLLDFQTSQTNAVNEAKQLKIKLENLTRENNGYQNLVWSRDQAVEDVKQAAKKMKEELYESRLQLTEKQKDCSKLEIQIQEMKKASDEEREKSFRHNQEVSKLQSKYANENMTRLSFLHTIYQCLVAGQTHQPNLNGGSYQEFSWEDMMRLLSDQVSTHISELNRNKEKVKYLEEALDKKDTHIKTTQDEHEATIKKLSETLKEREMTWKTQSREMEVHYGKLITDLHNRVQKTQGVADESWQNVQQLNAMREELEVQNKTLKNSRKKYIKEKTALLASCTLLAGTLWPLCKRMENLITQKRSLTDVNLRLSKLHKHTIFLCDTLNSELSDNASSVLTNSSLLLKFRVGVIVILALHRFINITRRQKTCFTVAVGIQTSLVALFREPKTVGADFLGISKNNHVPLARGMEMSSTWVNDDQLLSNVVTSMNDLCEMIMRRADKDPSYSWNPEFNEGIRRIAKHCYQNLLWQLWAIFDDDSKHLPDESRHHSSTCLTVLLGNGLQRCLRRTGKSKHSRYHNPEEVVKTLQGFVLSLTQRLHKLEVERRDLRMKTSDIKSENEALRTSVEKRQHENEKALGDVEDLRHKLTSAVPRGEFDKLYAELTNALEREKRAQDILNEQSEQLKIMEQKLNTVHNNSEETAITLAQAVKNLSEARMEIKRKEQSVRMITKDSRLAESEKRLLQEKLNDAEKATNAAAREKETALRYLKNVQKRLDENKTAIKQTRDGFYDLSKFLLGDTKLTTEGCPLGSTLLACQSVVNGFLEVHQQTLIMVTRADAEKQAAQLKVENLERDVTSCQAHINTLKDELTAACQRHWSDDEDVHGISIARNEPMRSHDKKNGHNESRDQNESDSYNQDFRPLMRYDSFSQIKSPKKTSDKSSRSR